MSHTDYSLAMAVDVLDQLVTGHRLDSESVLRGAIALALHVPQDDDMLATLSCLEALALNPDHVLTRADLDRAGQVASAARQAVGVH